MVRRVSKSFFASKEEVGRCAALGMETAAACPMMALGGGFHRFHGFLSGLRA